MQKQEMDKREKEPAKHEAVQPATKKAEEEAKKRFVNSNSIWSVFL